MNIAYIIICHKNFEQIMRLVNVLQHKNAYFFIHIDKKVNACSFCSSIEKTQSENIFIVQKE